MANQPSGAFFGVDPAEFQGPFASELDPRQAQARAQQQTQIPAPGGRISPFAAVAAISTKFLEGATAGRKERYAREEDEKAARLSALNSYMTAISNNPDISEEAKQAAYQKYFQAIGAQGLEVSGKGGKGGKGGKQQGTAGHVAGMMRDLFEGMTGGKMPKGGPEVGSTLADIQSLLYDQNGKLRDQHSASAQREKLGTGISEKLKGVDSAEGAAQVIAENYPQILKTYGPNAKEFINNVVSGFPQLGTPAYYDQAFTKSMATPPGSPPPEGPPRLSPTQLSMAEMAKRVIDKGDIEFTAPDGKKIQRYGQYVETPRGSFWYTQDEQGTPQPVLAADVRKASTSAASTREAYGKPQRGSDMPPDAQIRGGGKVDPDKVYVRITSGPDEGQFDAIIPPRTEARMGRAVMGGQLPPGTTDIFGRPVQPGQLYTPTLDSQGKPHAYINTAIQNEFKVYTDPTSGETYAIPVPRYQGQGGPPGAPPASEPPKSVPEPKTKPAPAADTAIKTIEKTTGRKLTDEQKSAVTANPFRKTEAPAEKEGTQKSGAPKGAISLGQRPTNLNATESKAFTAMDESWTMVNQLKTLLERKDPATGKPFYEENAAGDKARRVWDYLKYKAGFGSELDDLLGNQTSFLALQEIVGAQPYSTNSRAVQIWSQIKQHLPSPTDTPKLMYDKVQNMMRLLPEFRKTLEDITRTKKSGTRLIGPGAETPPGTDQSEPRHPVSPF